MRKKPPKTEAVAPEPLLIASASAAVPDIATRSGGTATIKTPSMTLTVNHGRAEVAARIATPPEAGVGGRFQSFDVIDANGVVHSVAVDLQGASVS